MQRKYDWKKSGTVNPKSPQRRVLKGKRTAEQGEEDMVTLDETFTDTDEARRGSTQYKFN